MRTKPTEQGLELRMTARPLDVGSTILSPNTSIGKREPDIRAVDFLLDQDRSAQYLARLLRKQDLVISGLLPCEPDQVRSVRKPEELSQPPIFSWYFALISFAQRKWTV